MEFTWIYVFSQIFVILYYFLEMVSYQLKNRQVILMVNGIAMIFMGVSYFLLNAYTGVATVGFGLLRNMVFLLDEKINGKSDKIKFKDIIIIILLTLILVVLSVITYDGIFSLMAPLATWLYMISLWQKNTMVYKILGIPVSIAGITYNIFISSLFGIIFEGAALISAIVGFFREKRDLHG
ncbi:MAG: YgjV family protein [Bacilli bacterium]|nr:YgjV family protein [Bacilli bacterium]